MSRNMKNIKVFSSANFQFLVMKFSIKGLLHGIGNLHWFLPTLGIG